MATLTLVQTFINHLPDGAYVAAATDVARTYSAEIPGEVRTYGQGRRRAVVGVGAIEQYPFRLLLVSAADVATLNSWRGETVQVRSNRGEVYVGIYRKLDRVKEYKSDLNRYDVLLTLEFVTYPVGV